MNQNIVVKKWKLCWMAMVVAGAFFLGASAQAAPESYPYQAVTTVGMVGDLVRAVGGDKAAVSVIIGEGVDPHLYKPTRNDVLALQNADIIFYNGLMLEGKMGDVLVRMARQGKPVFAVTEEILEKKDYLLSDDEEHYDPHVWMDVTGWRFGLEVVTKALSEYDPANADFYASNAEAFDSELKGLDDYAREVMASIPENQRVLVTAHDAFQYMGRAYGLQVRGIQGLSTESEAGVRDVENLVDFLAEHQIPAVFVETSVADKNVRALVEGARAKGQEVIIGGALFSDAMGPSGSYEGTYLGMIDHNVTTVTRALGGTAPEKGWKGKLGAAE